MSLTTTPRLEPGCEVDVFEHQLEPQQHEGRARLVRCIEVSEDQELWLVEFDDEPGELCERWIYTGRDDRRTAHVLERLARAPTHRRRWR